LVPDVVDAVATHARAMGAGRLNIQTNGVAIDDRFIDIVKRHRMGVGVSLDGPPAVNDVMRGRTADVLAGLARLEAAGVPFGVTAVVCRHTAATLPDLAFLLGGFATARSIGLDVLRPTGRATEDDLPDAKVLRDAYFALAARLDWINRRRAAPISLREQKAVFCGDTGGYCAAERGTAATLTPDGLIYPCAGLVGDPAYARGTAGAPDMEALRAGLHPNFSGCTECRVPGCRGRCPSRALISQRAAALDCVLRRAAASLCSEETPSCRAVN
ncbi:MAG: hypothetical protein JXQ84_02680, partial [Rhodospirillaceae bacterium]|nr:hypothetical protein [Rhodospirillaceae bacterium]